MKKYDDDNTVFVTVFAVLAILVLGFIGSTIPAFLWFAVDDTLAKLFEKPFLGELNFWTVYFVFYLLNVVLNATVSISKK